MAEFSALPLWTDAFLADTTHLDALETGAYLLLLMASWRTEDGGLPNDDRILARYAKVSGRQWSVIKKTVRAFFDVRSDGLLIQKRLEKERDFVRTRTASLSAMGSRAAQARWLKHKESLVPNASPKQRDGIAQEKPKQYETDAEPIRPATATVPEERKVSTAASSLRPAREPEAAATAAEPDPLVIPEFLARQGVQPTSAMLARVEEDEAYRLWSVVASDLRIPDTGFMNDERRRLLAVRLHECGGIEGWKIALEKVREAAFFTEPDGRTKTWVNLGFVLKAENFTGLMEGRYAERNRRDKPSSPIDALAAWSREGTG